MSAVRATRLLVLLAALGCQGIPAREIPERPIALRWWDSDTAQRRADRIAESSPATRAPRVAGVARVGDVVTYLEELTGTAAGEEEPYERAFPGRLAFLDPRSERVEPVPGVPAGALPRAGSADGRRVMFSQLVGRFRQLFELDRTTGQIAVLTRSPGVHADGCFGPEGRYVVASVQVEAERPVSRVLLISAGGVDPTPLGDGPSDYAPACAPDGRTVAWVTNDGRGLDRIFSLSPVPGGEPRDLGPGRSPAFSPDSQWIVYTAWVKGHWALHRIRPDGSGRHPIGQGTLDELDPSFSPDGRLVVYVGDDGFVKRLYLRRFDGSGDRVLLGSGGGTDPIW